MGYNIKENKYLSGSPTYSVWVNLSIFMGIVKVVWEVKAARLLPIPIGAGAIDTVMRRRLRSICPGFAPSVLEYLPSVVFRCYLGNEQVVAFALTILMNYSPRVASPFE